MVGFGVCPPNTNNLQEAEEGVSFRGTPKYPEAQPPDSWVNVGWKIETNTGLKRTNNLIRQEVSERFFRVRFTSFLFLKVEYLLSFGYVVGL